MGKKKTYHILVADDEPAVRQVLRDLILALGQEYTVYTAADSFEALHLIQSLSLDMALIDIFMPGLDGFELIRELRGNYPHLKIVVITGQPSYNMVLEALRLGAVDFLAKPISLAELRRILANLEVPDSEAAAAGPSLGSLPPRIQEKTQQTHERLQEQHFLHTIGEKLADIHSPRELYVFLTDMALSLSGGSQARFFLYDQEQGRLQLVSQSVDTQHLLITKPQVSTGQDGSGKLEPPTPLGQSLKLPLKMRGELLGVLQVDHHPGCQFDAPVMDQLALLGDRFVLALENLTLQESVFTNLYDTLRALINSLEARDPSTRHHSVRVTSIAAKFAEKIGLSPALVDSLRRAGALHDIGKIGIPDAILLKPGSLTPAEMEIIRQHPVIGDNIVAPLHLLPRERAIVLHHHERWDGKGYPLGLKGEEIPLLCRIIALADAYDAIISERPYRPRSSHHEALKEILNCSGTQFDPDLAQRFIEVMSQPFVQKELHNLEAELANSQPHLSKQQFQQLLRKIHHNVMFPGKGKDRPSLFHN